MIVRINDEFTLTENIVSVGEVKEAVSNTKFIVYFKVSVLGGKEEELVKEVKIKDMENKYPYSDCQHGEHIGIPYSEVYDFLINLKKLIIKNKEPLVIKAIEEVTKMQQELFALWSDNHSNIPVFKLKK